MTEPRSELADEAHRLVDAAIAWAGRTFPEPSDGHDAACRWCPLCQLTRSLRQDHPELAQQIAAAAASVAVAVRGLLDGATVGPVPGPGPGDTVHPAQPGASERVQHIRLDDPPASR